jgi:hypothetical protein
MTPKIIAFDADDTLFVDEPYFQETEHKFCELMSCCIVSSGQTKTKEEL